MLKRTMTKVPKATLKATLKATPKATLKRTMTKMPKATPKATLKPTRTKVPKVNQATLKATLQHPSSPPSTCTPAWVTPQDEKQAACTGKAELGKKRPSNTAYESPRRK